LGQIASSHTQYDFSPTNLPALIHQSYVLFIEGVRGTLVEDLYNLQPYFSHSTEFSSVGYIRGSNDSPTHPFPKDVLLLLPTVVGGGTIDFNYDKWTTDNPEYSGYHINLPGSTALSNCYITNPPPRTHVTPSVNKRRPGGAYLYDLTRCDPTETVPSSSKTQVKEKLQNTQRQKRKSTEKETKDDNSDRHLKSSEEDRMNLRSPEVRVPPPPPKATQTKQKTLSSVLEVIPPSSSSIMITQSNSKIGYKNAQPMALPDPPVGSQLVRKCNTAKNSETSLIQALSSDSQLTTVVSTVNTLMISQAQAQNETNQMFLAMMNTLKALSDKVDAMGDRGGGGAPSST